MGQPEAWRRYRQLRGGSWPPVGVRVPEKPNKSYLKRALTGAIGMKFWSKLLKRPAVAASQTKRAKPWWTIGAAESRSRIARCRPALQQSPRRPWPRSWLAQQAGPTKRVDQGTRRLAEYEAYALKALQAGNETWRWTVAEKIAGPSIKPTATSNIAPSVDAGQGHAQRSAGADGPWPALCRAGKAKCIRPCNRWSAQAQQPNRRALWRRPRSWRLAGDPEAALARQACGEAGIVAGVAGGRSVLARLKGACRFLIEPG
ncbi:hypothetical protein FQR65_LT20804 [Abscondita terminalis]|nr:hypothetical protein FQR65_LT20804 [Abscondita terminalis]